MSSSVLGSLKPASLKELAESTCSLSATTWGEKGCSLLSPFITDSATLDSDLEVALRNAGIRAVRAGGTSDELREAVSGRVHSALAQREAPGVVSAAILSLGSVARMQEDDTKRLAVLHPILDQLTENGTLTGIPVFAIANRIGVPKLVR